MTRTWRFSRPSWLRLPLNHPSGMPSWRGWRRRAIATQQALPCKHSLTPRDQHQCHFSPSSHRFPLPSSTSSASLPVFIAFGPQPPNPPEPSTSILFFYLDVSSNPDKSHVKMAERMTWDHRADHDLLTAIMQELQPSREQLRGVMARMHSFGYTCTIKAITYCPQICF